MIEHLDQAGQPCGRHPAVDPEAVLAYAIVGSRASAFHHDCASKLQSLVLALDEIGELAAGNGPLLRAVETATKATSELHALLNTNRALTKPAARAAVRMDALVTEAAARSHIAVRGELPQTEVMVTGPPTTHALALLLDLAAGVEGYHRVVDVAVAGSTLTISDRGVKVAPNAHVLVGLAAHVLARDGGELRCGADTFVVRMVSR